FCCVSRSAAHPHLHSFPTRRSSDLEGAADLHRSTALSHSSRLSPCCFLPAPRCRRCSLPAPWSPRCSHPAPRSPPGDRPSSPLRSEEHTSELQSREKLVCRLLLEKK